MKTPSDHLFKLIKTLTKGEKRAFRIKANYGKNAKKYLAIFNIMDSQEEYDEHAIKSKFSNENWIKRFNAAKEYLYKTLLEELSIYNQTHDPQFELSELLIRIRVLQSKGFYSEAYKLIEKAKILGNSLSNHLRMLEIINLESLNHPGGVNPNKSAEIRDYQRHIFKLLENESLYDALYKRSFVISTRSGYQGFNKEEAREYDELLTSDVLSNLDNAKTFKAKRQHINIHYFYSLGNGNYNEMHKWILEAKNLFESNPLCIKHQPVNYATTLLNLNNSYIKRRGLDEAKKAIQTLRTFYPNDKLKRHERLTYIIEYASLHHEIMLLVAFGEFNAGIEKVDNLNYFFKKHKVETSQAVFVRHYYLLAKNYFGVNDFKGCKSALDQIIENSKNQARKDIQKLARILLLMVYYEQNKMDLLEHTLRSSLRYFKKTGVLSQVEQKVFKLLQLSLDSFGDKGKARLELSSLEDLIEKNRFTTDFETLRQWVMSKLENTEFSTIVQKGYSKLNEWNN